jgi:CheY-like chemotaxis protein
MSRPILLVEDNSQDEKLVLRVLRKVNLASRVDIARDGQQALDYLFQTGEFAARAGAEQPAIVMLDISLPKVSGLEVLQRVRANKSTQFLPIVMLTSSDDDRDRMSSYTGGANSFVRKPLDFSEFSDTVERLGVYWTLMNQPPL